MCDTRDRGEATSGVRIGGFAGRCGRSRIPIAAMVAGLALGVAAPVAAWSQQPEQPGQAPATGGTDQALSLRYRFAEKYNPNEDPNRPEQLVQYQVGTTETQRDEIERPQGAPQQTGRIHRTIYTERVARLGRPGDVTETFRRYDRYDQFSLNGARQADPRTASLFKDLTLWYRTQPGRNAEVISLTADRFIHEAEYDYAVHQIFLPQLKAILPLQAVRVGDTWPIQRQQARALLGPLPEDGNFQLNGTLVQVARAPEGPTLTATIRVAGAVTLDEGQGIVEARITFEFEPPAAPPAAEPLAAAGRRGAADAARDAGIIEAIGHIAKVQMRRQLTAPLEDEPRLQRIITKDLVLHRRRAAGHPGGADPAPLIVPDRLPAADELNSWLLYDDPEDRFHLRHPQQLAVTEGLGDAIVFQYVRPDGRADTLIVGDIPKAKDAAEDRKWNDPQAFVKFIKDGATRMGFDVINGPMGYLPDGEWAPLKRRVYRYEAGLKRPDASRVYLDAYLVLFSRGDHFVVRALTEHNDHVTFRDQVEKVIRSLELGGSPATAPGAPEQPRNTPPAAARPDAGAPAPPVPPGRTP